MPKNAAPKPHDTYRRYETRIHRHIKSKNFQAAIQLLEAALAVEPKSPFHAASDISWHSRAEAAARWLKGVYSGASPDAPIAIYCEMNRFEINTKQWSVGAFLYDTVGDPRELDWLSNWTAAEKKALILPGMIALKSAFRKHFEEGNGPPPEWNASAELAILLVATRMQELLHVAVKSARQNGWLPEELLVFVGVHDSDLVAMEATSSAVKVLKRAKRKAWGWQELSSVRLDESHGRGVYLMDPGHDAKGRSYPRDSLHFEGPDEDLDALDKRTPLARNWRPLSVTFRRGLWTSDILQVYCFATAVNERAVKALAPLVGKSVEWLPIKTNADEPLFLIHPLVHLHLDANAEHNGGNGRNITVIRRYSFRPADLKNVHMFQIVGPPDSPAGAAAHAMHHICVSDDFVQMVEQHGLRGMVFKKIFSTA
jgi:hypothetical protein